MTGGAQPPCEEGKGGEDADDYEVWVDQDSMEARLVPGDTGPVGGGLEQERHVEERGPVGKGKEGRGGYGRARLAGGPPQKPDGGASDSGKEEQQDGRVITGVGMPEGVEQVIAAPVEEEGHQGASGEDEGEKDSGDSGAIHSDQYLL